MINFFKAIFIALGRTLHKWYGYATLQPFWDELIDSGLMKDDRVPFRQWLSDKLPQDIVNVLCGFIGLFFVTCLWAVVAVLIVVPIGLVLSFLGIWG